MDAPAPKAIYFKMFSGGPIRSKPRRFVYTGPRDLRGFDELRFYRGRLIEDWPEGIEFSVRGTVPPDYLSVGLHWMTVSERAKVVLEANNIQGVQFLPLSVVATEAGRTYRYWALNVFQVVDGVDWDGCEYIDNDPDPARRETRANVWRYALRFERVRDVDIFRLLIEGKGHVLVFVSPGLKGWLEAGRVDEGFVFNPIAAY